MKFFQIFAWLGLPVRDAEKRLCPLRNKHRCSKVFILGNGPSVSNEDLNSLQGEISIAANRFHLSYSSTNFRPTYTVCVDNLMLSNHGKEISQKCENYFFIPYAYWRNGPDWTRRKNVIPFHYRILELFRKTKFSPSAIFGMSNGDTVIFLAMQLAVWMGSTHLVLLGVDHEFILPPDYVSDEEPVTDSGEKNHFIHNYRQSGEKWWPPKLERIDQAFLLAERYGALQNLKIVNSTRGGKLEIFQRSPLEAELITRH